MLRLGLFLGMLVGAAAALVTQPPVETPMDEDEDDGAGLNLVSRRVRQALQAGREAAAETEVTMLATYDSLRRGHRRP